MNLDSIVDVRIHPAIGIARVGNSPDEYFIGPELPYPTAAPQGGYRDPQGRLKRQAARFRVYGYDALGNVVAELTSDVAQINWTVHVANKKASWYQFDMPLDLRPEAGQIESPLRNAGVSDRHQLDIDPGPRTISGAGQRGVKFDNGLFGSEPVPLGELQTDDQGRLIVLGGFGKSGTPFPGYTLNTFANNPGWFDDISDGPVEATVTIGGKRFEADGAWVVTAPPNYAPDIVPMVTMYDLILSALNGSVIILPPKAVSFTEDILPILQRLSNFQWVNYGFFVQFGWQAPYDFLQPDFLARLAAPGKEFQELRRQIFNLFRNPQSPIFTSWQWPPIYGDALGDTIAGAESPRNGLSVTLRMYNHLSAWANGSFTSDYPDDDVPPQTLDQCPLNHQPDTLDRAALTFCAGGPFHPGCELTWPMRQACLYRGKFRLRKHPPGYAYPDYGKFLSQVTALATSGPLSASGPGDLTRWMSVPWQADTASCSDGYPQFQTPTLFVTDDYLPTFWPARAPDEVLKEADYQTAVDTTKPLADRIAAFNRRADWPRALNLHAPYLSQLTAMVTKFGELGVVEQRPGVLNDKNFPPVMYVESLPATQSAVELHAPVAREEMQAKSALLFQARYGGRRQF